MNQDLSIVSLILNASWVVKLVVLLLVTYFPWFVEVVPRLLQGR